VATAPGSAALPAHPDLNVGGVPPPRESRATIAEPGRFSRRQRCKRSLEPGHHLRPLRLLRETIACLFALAAWPVVVLAADALGAQPLLLDGTLVGTDVIAVGERGTILRSPDQGVTWERIPSPTRAALTGISFAPLTDSRHGWAVGHDAEIIATTDSGRTWARQHQGENLQDSFLDVLALDAQRVIAVGAYGLFVVTADGGRTWERRKIADDDYHFNRLSRGPSGTLYLAGEHGTLLRSEDLGSTWKTIASPYDGSFYGVLVLDHRTLIAHGLRGRVYSSSDDGASWQLVATPTPALLATAIRLKDNTLVFAGQARAMFLSRDAGKTVTDSPAPLATAVAELVELPNGNLLALGEAGATRLPAP
jgi:photosystem II stability/assembly factor-like uncharacterized protein